MINIYECFHCGSYCDADKSCECLRLDCSLDEQVELEEKAGTAPAAYQAIKF